MMSFGSFSLLLAAKALFLYQCTWPLGIKRAPSLCVSGGRMLILFDVPVTYLQQCSSVSFRKQPILSVP